MVHPGHADEVRTFKARDAGSRCLNLNGSTAHQRALPSVLEAAPPLLTSVNERDGSTLFSPVRT